MKNLTERDIDKEILVTLLKYVFEELISQP